MTNDFCPVRWPEIPTPCKQIDCQECGLYEHGSRMVWGEGNPDARIMVILDNPGLREDKEGNPFVCGTRQALQQAAHHVGLGSEDIYVTYILKRKPTRAYDKENVRKICMRHLDEQFGITQPGHVLCLGNVAVHSFFQDTDAEVKTLRQQLHHVRGYPTTVAYHPLAVRRRPNLWAKFTEDWEFLAKCRHQNLQ
ncbi:uracil-DNA glycosylase [Virgibacillus siamensis]|uniref:uracil-DNA glycosylase n=1 Tax=Virgibacillus siamensis TaxID=480071 RepID=UPI00098595B0|nr:uracil-DNA glycosylase [Virgibacillus siamensis]